MTPAQLLEGLKARLEEPVRWNECENAEFRWLLECERRRRRLAQFEAVEDPADREELENLERQRCELSAQHFIENYVWIEDPHRTNPAESHMKEMPFVLWPAQVEALAEMKRALDDGVDLVITKGRKLGVSWLVQAFALWQFLFGYRFAMRCASRTQADVEDFTPESLIGKFRFMIERLPGFLRPDLRRDKMMHLEQWGGSRITGEATTRGLARGRRSALLMLDEFAHIEGPIQRRILTASETVAVSRFWVSTPNGPGNTFADVLLGQASPRRRVLAMTWRDDPSRTEAWATATRDDLGVELFEQEHEGKVTKIAAGKIWQARRASVQYDDVDPRFDPAWRKLQPLISGWDFGSGPSLLASPYAIYEPVADGRFRLWIDDELVWKSTSWRTAGADAIKKAKNYGWSWVAYGDPSGIQVESDQESWESNLKAAGVPLFCLETKGGKFEREEIEQGFRRVQAMLDDGLLMIHVRCREVWMSVEHWRRAVKEGLSEAEIEMLDKVYIGHDHGRFSHMGMALCYLARGAAIAHDQQLIAIQSRKNQPFEEVHHDQPSASQMMSRVRGRRSN